LVIIRRFGLNGSGKESLDSIARDLGLSRERIRQIQLRAFQRIRENPRGRKLAAFVS
jgi:DNA-directed RNA polymerase sigma subunit (sigma70/sigma32)